MTPTMTPLDHAAALLGDRAQVDASLSPFTTYRVGGAAALLVLVESEEDLRVLADAVTQSQVPTLAIGRGSNLLVADAGFPGIAFRLGSAFERSSVPAAADGDENDVDGATVQAGGAVSLPVLARITARHGLTGFEWAVGVPGSVGGAVRMNAGGHGSDMAASLARVRVVDLQGGEDGVVPATALDLAYRHSNLGPSQVVVSAELALEVGDVATSEAELAEIVRWRRANQPGGQNAGSVFTNPPGDSAGRLIEAAGAKGLRVGSAAVSTKHANFIQVDAGGSADDVYRLMAAIRARVEGETGIDLIPETHMVGFS